MPTLLLENIPGDVYEQIQRQAQAKNRTLSEEAVRLLREGLRPQEPTVPETVTTLPPAAEVRQTSSRLPSSSDFILDTGEMPAPFDLPRPEPGVPVPARFAGDRLPEPFLTEDESESNHV